MNEGERDCSPYFFSDSFRGWRAAEKRLEEGRRRATLRQGALPASQTARGGVRLVEGCSGWADRVDEEAEEKDVANELPQAAETETEIDAIGVSEKLQCEVVTAIDEKCKEIAQAVVAAAIEGHIQSFKALLEMLERARTLQAAATKTVTRSIASAWGAEPEWRDGDRADCAMRKAA